MRKYTPKLDKKSFLVSSKYPSEQKNYILYFHSGVDEFEVYLELDRVIILKKIDGKDFKDFLYILEKD